MTRVPPRARVLIGVGAALAVHAQAAAAAERAGSAASALPVASAASNGSAPTVPSAKSARAVGAAGAIATVAAAGAEGAAGSAQPAGFSAEIAKVDSLARRVTLKASMGQQALRVAAGVPLEALKPGDKVRVGFGQDAGESVITRIDILRD